MEVYEEIREILKVWGYDNPNGIYEFGILTIVVDDGNNIRFICDGYEIYEDNLRLGYYSDDIEILYPLIRHNVEFNKFHDVIWRVSNHLSKMYNSTTNYDDYLDYTVLLFSSYLSKRFGYNSVTPDDSVLTKGDVTISIMKECDYVVVNNRVFANALVNFNEVCDYISSLE